MENSGYYVMYEHNRDLSFYDLLFIISKHLYSSMFVTNLTVSTCNESTSASNKQLYWHSKTYKPVSFLFFKWKRWKTNETLRFTIQQLVIAWLGRPALSVCKHCHNDGHE